MLIFPLNVFPWVLNGLIEAWVSLNRVNRFLILEELDWQEFYSSSIEDGDKDSGAMVVIENGGFTWNAKEVDGGANSNETNDVSHSNDLLKREKTYDDEADKTVHTQALQNIDLSVYQVQLCNAKKVVCYQFTHIYNSNAWLPLFHSMLTLSEQW